MNTKKFSRIVLAATAILLIPLVAMQLTDQVVWTGTDFIFAWVLLVGFGIGLTTAFNQATSAAARFFGGGIALGLAVLWVVLATA